MRWGWVDCWKEIGREFTTASSGVRWCFRRTCGKINLNFKTRTVLLSGGYYTVGSETVLSRKLIEFLFSLKRLELLPRFFFFFLIFFFACAFNLNSIPKQKVNIHVSPRFVARDARVLSLFFLSISLCYFRDEKCLKLFGVPLHILRR